jgi:crotonobetainyl-CoA:carnitine CoA-transferase CaiB-like acyl-CoA transferase
MKPLRNLLILDCSTHLPGPFVGKLIAMQGARVLKIENPDRPDPAREMGALYDDLNQCKELVPLNLTKEKDRAHFSDFVRKADGLIEGFRPNAKLKLGLDEKSLHSLNPKLCIASLVGYPENSPRRDVPGHDLNFEALTGVLSLFNEMPALPLADLFSAYQAALSLVSAILNAQSSGVGSRAVVSMTETLLEVQSGLRLEYRKTKAAPLPGTTLFSGQYPCYRMYRSQDGRRIAVGSLEQKFWDQVCDILGVPELKKEGYARGEKAVEIASRVQAAFLKKPWRDWAPLFEKAQCCVEPVLDYSEVNPLGLQS